MVTNFWQKLDSMARASLPFTITLVFVLLGGLTWPLPWLGEVAPPLALMAIYYWAVYKPTLFHASAAFIVGLLHDIVHFLPLGLSAMIFVIMYQTAYSQRRFFLGHSFIVFWAGFALFNVLASIGFWFIQSVLVDKTAPLLPLSLQVIMAIVLFPLVAGLMVYINHTLIKGQDVLEP